MNIAFLTTSAVALIATGLVITGRNTVHALLYLVVSLLAVAVIFMLLGAPFAAALEVIIYAGAIMVLFLFVVMMTEAASSAEQRLTDVRIWIGPALLSAVLLAELVLLALGLPGDGGSGSGIGPGAETIQTVGPTAVGTRLLGPYLLAVELASMLLLAGLVGAWHLGRPTRPAAASTDAPPPRKEAER
jgi:NADH-quinone oxidoreductase subunit J